MRNQVNLIFGICGCLLVGVSGAHAAPANTASPATPPVTTVPPARAATPMPVPERTAAPVPTAGIRPISTEKGYKVAQAKKLIWWGAGFGIFGGAVSAVGLFLVVYGHTAGDDDVYYMTGYGVLGLGLLVVLATSPVWIVGLLKKSKAERTEAQEKVLPKRHRFVDTAHWRDYRRLIQRSGPPAVPVAAYGFRF